MLRQALIYYKKFDQLSVIYSNFSGSSLQTPYGCLLAQASHNRVLYGIFVSVQRATVL